jgi:sugar phosphate isomerase/epimerase
MKSSPKKSIQMKLRILIPIFFVAYSLSFGQEKLLFFQTDWGNELSWDAFCEKVRNDGYDGIEVWFPDDIEDQIALKSAIEKYDLMVIYLAGTDKSLPFEDSLSSYTEHLKRLIALKPAAINCHSGNDFFTMDQNKAFINAANKLSKENNIPIYHETHRGRFSYNLPDTNRYLEDLPELKLTLDISHWMVVHESLLESQDKNLEKVMANSHHIHARVGHPEGPQVNDPEAPEWKKALDRHIDIWEKVIRERWNESGGLCTVTTEFGPPDYLPALPYTQVPVADQWKANVFIMNAIKQRMYDK